MGSAPGWARWLRVGIITVCIGFYAINFHSLQIGHHVDDGVYVSLGRSLNHGLGYVRFADPTHPHEPQYPPVFALLVAGTFALFGDTIEALRYISLAFSVISLLLADVFFRRRLSVEITGSYLWHPIALALFGLNHLVVGYAGMVMTEAAFICLSLGVIVWLDRMAGERDASRWSWVFSAVGLAALLAAAGLTRAPGYSYIVVASLYLWQVGQRHRAVVVGVMAMVFVAPWLVLQRQFTGSWFGAGYLVDVTGRGETAWPLLLRPIENLFEYAARLLPQAITPFFGIQVEALFARISLDLLPPVLGLLVTAFTVWGIVRLVQGRRDPALYLAMALMLLLLVWPYRYTRFCLPFLPLCAGGFVFAAARLPGAMRWGGWLLVGLALAGFVTRDVQMVFSPPRDRFVDLQTIAGFVEEYTEDGAIVVTHGAEAVAVYSTRAIMPISPPKAPGIPSEPDANELLERIGELEPVYILVFGALANEQAMLPPQFERLPLTPVADSIEPSMKLFRLVK